MFIARLYVSRIVFSILAIIEIIMLIFFDIYMHCFILSSANTDLFLYTQALN